VIPALPVALAPPAPFPLVLAQSREEEFVAPGVVRATYHLTTSDGPLAISLIAIDTREPSVRIESVVANDRMISRGETLSSMARRTGAIAGVNADYFDIGQTNQPLNLVVRDGALLRTPSKRIVLAVHRDRTVKFERASFSGTVAYGTSTVPLTTINEWPPQGGAGFLNAAYGARKDAPGVRVFALVPSDASRPVTDISGTYRVAAIEAPASQTQDATSGIMGPELALGPAALAIATPPAVGDDVTISANLTPPIDDLRTAVGGGPLLVAGGAVTSDPFSPAPEETNTRFPVSGAGTTDDGELVLASVDGRQNDLSIGLTRPQFAALWLGLGATDAMAFDSGGSAETVARVLGDSTASVTGSPSDGEERAVADGLFVYSDAPQGPPSRLVVRPHDIVALAGVDVPIVVAVTDAAGHSFGVAHAVGGDMLAVGAASHDAIVRGAGTASGLSTRVPIDVVAKPATLAITSDIRNPDPGDLVHLRAIARDARGRAIVLGDRVRWSATPGTFVAPGVLRAGSRDAAVVAMVAGVDATLRVPVGHRDVALAAFASAQTMTWQFSTVPRSGRGTVSLANDELELAYDFTLDGRAAYANGTYAIPGEPQAFSVDVRGDGNGVGLRAAFVNKFGERRALTLAKSVDWKGWQRVTIPLPDDLNPPVRLVSLYAFDGLGGVATHRAGTLAFRSASATIAGTP
jgi:exopolysaccharide biosynthesis protein